MLTAAISPFFRLCPFPVASFLSEGNLSHADPVVPILIASIFITLGAALGGLLMKYLRQPAVLGELLVGLLAGNLGYYCGAVDGILGPKTETALRAFQIVNGLSATGALDAATRSLLEGGHDGSS